MKHCKNCNITKPLDEFHKNKHSKDGHQEACKPCRCFIALEWKRNNKERIKIVNGEWERRNPDKVKAMKDKYAKKNPGKRNSYTATRRALKKQATPKWLTVEQKKKKYSNFI